MRGLNQEGFVYRVNAFFSRLSCHREKGVSVLILRRHAFGQCLACADVTSMVSHDTGSKGHALQKESSLA